MISTDIIKTLGTETINESIVGNNNLDSNADNSDVDSTMDYLETHELEKTDKELLEEEDKKKLIIPGIDLGTTNSCISYWKDNTCMIITDEFGNKTIPSFVSYTNISKYVGSEAKKQKDINVENVFYEVKRLIGRDFKEKAVQDCLNLLSYNIIENDRGRVSIQSSVRGNKIFTPEEISASVLSKLKDMAQKHLKREIKDVVITVPANFTDSQRQATHDAAKIAGLNCVRMFHEPTAAALAYGMMDRSINKALYTTNDKLQNNSGEPNKSDETNETEKSDETNETKKPDELGEDDKSGILILVYDFGGGTLDVSLINVFNGIFEVQGTSGISHFGGVDFDNRLINYCLAKFSRQFYSDSKKIDTNTITRVSLQKLRTQCETAKKILSTNNNAVIAVENFHNGKDMFVKINRSDFENLCRDLFLLCIHPIDELLNEFEKTEKDIDEVILVGGMTRMPYIRELLNSKFISPDKRCKVNCSINPDEAVSVGAAIQGYIIANSDNAFSDSVMLMDVTPLSLGVEVIGGVMDVLIKRNTMIPYEKTKLYSTDTDNVDSVLVKIFEGERALTMHNTKIGEFELDKIPVCQRGVPEIEICFIIDINGMVTVTAVEKDINEKKSIIVNTNKNGLKPNELQALIEEAAEQETMDELDRAKKYYYYEIEDLCSNVLSNINNKEFKLTKRDVTSITEDVTNILSWLKEKTYKERSTDDFNDTLDKMKKKYGVLILCGKQSDNKVKAFSEYVDATTLYCKDDDEEEEEMRQAFEKVRTIEMGAEGMSDNDVIEIKDMRDALMDLCKTVSGIICSGKMNLSNDHKQEVIHYIDDVMMWYYSHEKPTKIDYKEKIDYINSICDEIVENFEKDGKSLFIKSELESGTNTNSQKLEKMCLTLLTMIDNKQLLGSKASFAILSKKLQNILKFVYTRIKDSEPSNPNNDKIQSDSSDKMTEEDFQKKCQEYIDDINVTCDSIHNTVQGINMRQGPIVVLSKKSVHDNDVVTNQFKIENKEDDTSDKDTDNVKKGLNIMDLMRMKQNEEIDEMIDRELESCDDKNTEHVESRADKYKLFITS
jgi:heat shock protein 1/8